MFQDIQVETTDEFVIEKDSNEGLFFLILKGKNKQTLPVSHAHIFVYGATYLLSFIPSMNKKEYENYNDVVFSQDYIIVDVEEATPNQYILTTPLPSDSSDYKVGPLSVEITIAEDMASVTFVAKEHGVEIAEVGRTHFFVDWTEGYLTNTAFLMTLHLWLAIEPWNEDDENLPTVSINPSSFLHLEVNNGFYTEEEVYDLINHASYAFRRVSSMRAALDEMDFDLLFFSFEDKALVLTYPDRVVSCEVEMTQAGAKP